MKGHRVHGIVKKNFFIQKSNFQCISKRSNRATHVVVVDAIDVEY